MKNEMGDLAHDMDDLIATRFQENVTDETPFSTETRDGRNGNNHDRDFIQQAQELFHARMDRLSAKVLRIKRKMLSPFPPKWRRRAGWIINKGVLFALNMGQFEYQRRQRIKSAENRLRDIPEFPLL